VAITASTLDTFSGFITCLPVSGFLPPSGEGRGHGCKVFHVGADRALLGVDIRGLHWIGFDISIGIHQVSDGLIALVSIRLRLENFLIDRKRVARKV
jgi:hypothetical protein